MAPAAPGGGGGGGGDNVKVAVRVRPFLEREKGSQCIVEMEGSTTHITDPKGAKGRKSFNFDHSYWSHDGFETNAEGVFVPTNEKYADQQRVFDDLGRGVLDNAWQGYNATLFAYGQTGSGKSYSVLGYGPNKGIVPIVAEELFKSISENKDPAKSFQVSFSMLEIYNEHIRDLLNYKQMPRGGLKVRQNPRSGFFVDGLKSVAVKSFKEIEKLIDEGTENRTVASTNMNATSSRSHMVITIRFTQVTALGKTGKKGTKSSDINLVDLAGSERADSTGATGDRLKEGSAINQSLSTLGNVISALADLSTGKKKNVLVPYRESVLTMLLQNALGGNSKTLMIAAISPAAINFDESLGTLRYADRAKQIKNKAIVNEDPTEKLIRELKEENQRLQEMLAKGGAAGGAAADSAEAREMAEKLAANERYMQEMNVSWEQKLKDAQREWEEKQHKAGVSKEATHAYLANVNEDPSLSGVIRHYLEIGKTVVGRADAENKPQISLKGLSILKEHALIKNNGKACSITPTKQSNLRAKVAVNGRIIKKETRLRHMDRVLIGSNHLYVFNGHPAERGPPEDGGSYPNVDYEFCQQELASAAGLTADVAGDNQDDADRIREDLVRLLPMVSEANAMSEELRKGVRFDLIVKSGQSHNLLDNSKEVAVKLTSDRNTYVWMWDKGKFINRKYMMQELYEQFMETATLPDTDREKDPFWDPPEDLFLGSVFVYLQSLGYMIDMDESLPVTNYQGREEGILQVAVCTCDPKGNELGEDNFVDNPRQLLGKRLDFLVKIPHASGVKWLEADETRGCFCRYTFYTAKTQYETPCVAGTMNPDFEHKKRFTIKPATEQFLNYLLNGAVVVEVWGRQGDGTVVPNPRARRRYDESGSRCGSATSRTSDVYAPGLDAAIAGVEGEEKIRAMRDKLKHQAQEIEILKIEKENLQKESKRLKKKRSASASNTSGSSSVGVDEILEQADSFAEFVVEWRNMLHTVEEEVTPSGADEKKAKEALKGKFKTLKGMLDEQGPKAARMEKMIKEQLSAMKKEMEAVEKAKKKK